MNHETRETFGTQTVHGNIFSFLHSQRSHLIKESRTSDCNSTKINRQRMNVCGRHMKMNENMLGILKMRHAIPDFRHRDTALID